MQLLFESFVHSYKHKTGDLKITNSIIRYIETVGDLNKNRNNKTGFHVHVNDELSNTFAVFAALKYMDVTLHIAEDYCIFGSFEIDPEHDTVITYPSDEDIVYDLPVFSDVKTYVTVYDIKRLKTITDFPIDLYNILILDPFHKEEVITVFYYEKNNPTKKPITKIIKY
jgi:hypothetical protein